MTYLILWTPIVSQKSRNTLKNKTKWKIVFALIGDTVVICTFVDLQITEFTKIFRIRVDTYTEQ